MAQSAHNRYALGVDIGGSLLDALRQKQLERLEGCLPDD